MNIPKMIFGKLHEPRKYRQDPETGVTIKSWSISQEPADVECPVWGALALVLRLSGWLGIAPLTFRTQGSQLMMRFSRTRAICSFCIAAVTSIMLILGFVIDMRVDRESSVRMSTAMACGIWCIDLIMMLLTTDIGVFGAPTRMKKLIPCINHIDSIITKLKKGRPSRPREKMKCMFVLGAVAWSVGIGVCDIWTFVYEALHFNKDMNVVILNSVYYVHAVTSMVLELQFVFMALLVHSALISLNDVLTDLLSIDAKINPYFKSTHASDDVNPMRSINILVDSISLDRNDYADILSPTQLKKTEVTLRSVCLAYTAICDVLRRVNDTNEAVIILLLVSIIIQMVVTPYYLVAYLFSSNMGMLAMSMQVVWCIYHSFKTILIVEPGHRTILEIEKMQTLTSWLLSRMTSPGYSLSGEVELFCRQIDLNKFTYTPVGLCVLNRSLIASMLGAVTTYVVILVQFQTTT